MLAVYMQECKCCTHGCMCMSTCKMLPMAKCYWYIMNVTYARMCSLNFPILAYLTGSHITTQLQIGSLIYIHQILHAYTPACTHNHAYIYSHTNTHNIRLSCKVREQFCCMLPSRNIEKKYREY